jgi:hypothetical protein
MPRSRYTATPEDRLRVRRLASIGLSDDDIGSQLHLPSRKLQKVFQLELKEGAAEGRELALQTLYDRALTGENLGALTFWVKARCGWRDTGTIQSATQFDRHITRFRPLSAATQLPESAPPGMVE